MKNVLFVVRNEYHLFSAICMYYKYFSSKEYSFKMIIIKRFQNMRMEDSYDLPFEYFVFDDYLNFQDYRAVTNYPDYEKQLSDIYSTVDELYTYFDFSLLITIIVNWVKRKSNAKAYLVQEGVGGYYDYNINQWVFRRALKSYIPYLYIKYVRNVKNVDFVYRWGGYDKIDELKAFYPEKIKKHIKAKPTSFNLEVGSEINSKIKKIFSFEFKSDSSKRYLLYLPIGGSRDSIVAKNKEFTLLEQLINSPKTKSFEFIIKIKSGVDSGIYQERYGDKVKIIDAKIPVEILLSDIHNSIVVSAFSSASMHQVNNNANIWVYPLLDYKTTLMPFTPNIKLVQSYSELEQCIK